MLLRSMLLLPLTGVYFALLYHIFEYHIKTIYEYYFWNPHLRFIYLRRLVQDPVDKLFDEDIHEKMLKDKKHSVEHIGRRIRKKLRLSNTDKKHQQKSQY